MCSEDRISLFNTAYGLIVKVTVKLSLCLIKYHAMKTRFDCGVVYFSAWKTYITDETRSVDI
jgi:hypothetical protein